MKTVWSWPRIISWAGCRECPSIVNWVVRDTPKFPRNAKVERCPTQKEFPGASSGGNILTMQRQRRAWESRGCPRRIEASYLAAEVPTVGVANAYACLPRACATDVNAEIAPDSPAALSRRILMSTSCLRDANARDVEGEGPRARETPFIRGTHCDMTSPAECAMRCGNGARLPVVCNTQGVIQWSDSPPRGSSVNSPRQADLSRE